MADSDERDEDSDKYISESYSRSMYLCERELLLDGRDSGQRPQLGGGELRWRAPRRSL